MITWSLTDTPTLETVSWAVMTVAVPTTLLSCSIKKGVKSAINIAIIAVAGVAFDTLQKSYDPVPIAACAFAIGFVIGYNKKQNVVPPAVCAVLNGVDFSVTWGTPLGKMIVNKLAAIGARTFGFISKSVVKFATEV